MTWYHYGDWLPASRPPSTDPGVERNEPEYRTLLGPRGEVLRTFSDRPPTGFHQGTRTKGDHE